MRTLVVWCPDWSVIAAELVDDVPVQAPVAVLHANRVLVTSPAARAEGVRRGLRKREAQGRCPQLIVVEYDAARDARAFEPVLAAVEALAPGVQVLRPGACALLARGPARYFGGEEAAAERLVEHIAQQCGVEAQVGIADGTFAAGLAARFGRLVPIGQTPAFLAGIDIGALDVGVPGNANGSLVDLLRRLGVHTLGAFAALPAGDVLARFGMDAALAHRLAAGQDERPLAPRQAPPELEVVETFDDPVERVDVAAFAARGLAERLHEQLSRYGLACTRLAIEAHTANGEALHRTWRHDGLLGIGGIADRLRWQLDGWLTQRNRAGNRTAFRSGTAAGPTAGIVRLRLIPEGVVTHLGLQPGLWGEAGEERDRAYRVLVRVQGLLGPEAVLVPVPNGGRTQLDRVRWVPFGDERTPDRLPAPWPGRLPAPSPATVYAEPLPVAVYDIEGAPVGVTGRLAVTAPPARVALADEPASVAVAGWAGPWPIDERWWTVYAGDIDDEPRRCARFQVLLADGRALLLVLAAGHWQVEASYD